MKKKPLLTALLLLLFSVCCAQSANIGKLQQQLPFIKDSLRYVDALNRIAMLSYEKNIDTTFYYTTRARIIADRLQYTKGQADAVNNLGIVFDLKSNPQLGLRYYNDAYNLYVTLHDSSNMVQTMMNIAMVYQEIGKTAKAMRSFKKTIAFGKRISQDSIMSLVYYNYALEYPDSIGKDSIPVYIRMANQIALKYHDERVLLAVEQLTADNLIRNGQRDKGVALLQQAIAKAVQSNLYYISMDMFMDLGDQFSATDSAKATGYYKKALAITRQKAFKIYTGLFTKRLYEFYIAKKDNATALSYSRELLKLNEEQEKIDNDSGIDYIEYALKDQQLASARAQSKDQLKFLFFATLLCAMTIIIIIILWRNWKQLRGTTAALRLQFEQSESTMEALDVMNKNYARLIKIVAHDLRNPIGAINSITEIIPAETLTDEIKELIDLVQASSKTSLELINELLEADFGEEQNFKNEAVNLDELLRQCVRLLNFRAEDKQQHIILNSHVHGTINGDQEKLWRVMNNLVTNAIKFSPQGGEISVEAKSARNGILISVKDTGIGIPADIQNKIFDPFTTSRRKGTQGEQPFGLGLYISKQIVEAHNGKIWLESEDGKGTTFYVELPAA